MYNPFPLLNEQLLVDKIKAGKRYFVRQTYRRGFDRTIIAAFLLRAYEDDEEIQANQHLSVLSKDGNAYLYDANNPEHLEKLVIAARQPHGYKIFYAGKKGVDWKPPIVYQTKIRNYIRTKHPDWRTKKGGDQVTTGLFEEFGMLFLKFSFDKEEDKIPFDEIEKY